MFIIHSLGSCKYIQDFSDKTNIKNGNQKRQKSPYPYYDWQLQQHQKDQDIYAETRRENLEQHNEHQKQYAESMNENRESTRQVCETHRETQEKIALTANPLKNASANHASKKGVLLKFI